MKNLLGSIAILLAATATTAFSQTFSTPIQVSVAAGAHSPAMHVGRDGTIFVSWFHANADIYFSRSTDGGMSFLPPVRASRQVTTNQYTSLLQRAPEFAIDTKGTIHLVWTEGRTRKPGTTQEQSDVWYIRSTDNGSTWTLPVSIIDPDDSQMYAQDFSAIACDSSDNLYVSYLDNRYLVRGVAGHYKMHLQRSTDGGATWSLPVIADKLPLPNSGTCECCRQDIAASKDGHIYIGFRTNMTVSALDEKRDIFVSRSMDGGRTFDSSIRVQLGGWTLNGCPTKGPHIALDANENLHVAWNDARDDTARLVAYYTLLRKGDSTVFPNYSLSIKGSEQGHWPDVVFAGGITAAAFMPMQNGLPIQLSYSTNGGNTWSRSAAFPGSAGDDQELPIIQFDASGNLLAVWQDGDKDGILFTKITALSRAVPPDMLSPTVDLSKPGTVRLGWSQTPPMKSMWYYLNVVSPGGTTSINTRDTTISFPVTPGNYDIAIAAATTTGTSNNYGVRFTITEAGVLQSTNTRLAIYPNPVHNGRMVLNAMQIAGLEAKIRLLDALGKTVWQTKLQSAGNEISIPVQGLAKGIYRCEVEAGNHSYRVAITID